MRCREIILKGAAKQEGEGIDAAVPSAPLLPIGFAKQNLRGIGRMANSIPNGFFGMATRKLCCMGNVVSFAPLLPIGFAKQNLRCIGRMTNSTLNKFAGVVKQYLRLVKTQHSQSPYAQKTVGVSRLSLHNCPFIFLLLALCASLFPFHSPLFTFLLLYFFNFQLPLFLIFYFFNFLLLSAALYFFTFLIFYFSFHVIFRTR